MVGKIFFKQLKALVPYGGHARLFSAATDVAESYWITRPDGSWRTVVLNGGVDWFHVSFKGGRNWFR